MPRIDGTRIAELIREAYDDVDLRVRLFHCPDRVIADLHLSEDEQRAIRTGDLSQVDLDDDTLQSGRRIFTEVPKIEGQHKAAAQYLLFSSEEIQRLCA
jgi:hypothetical protein